MAVEQVKITGAKFFNGNIDGKTIDSGKIYVEEQLDFTTGRAAGYASQEYALGSADAVKSLIHNPFPFVAEVDFLRVTNGDRTKTVVVGVRPLEMVKPSANDQKKS